MFSLIDYHRSRKGKQVSTSRGSILMIAKNERKRERETNSRQSTQEQKIYKEIDCKLRKNLN